MRQSPLPSGSRRHGLVAIVVPAAATDHSRCHVWWYGRSPCWDDTIGPLQTLRVDAVPWAE